MGLGLTTQFSSSHAPPYRILHSVYTPCLAAEYLYLHVSPHDYKPKNSFHLFLSLLLAALTRIFFLPLVSQRPLDAFSGVTTLRVDFRDCRSRSPSICYGCSPEQCGGPSGGYVSSTRKSIDRSLYTLTVAMKRIATVAICVKSYYFCET